MQRRWGLLVRSMFVSMVLGPLPLGGFSANGGSMRVVLTTNFSPWSGYGGGGQRSTHQLASALSTRKARGDCCVYIKTALDTVGTIEPNYGVVWAPFLVFVLYDRHHYARSMHFCSQRRQAHCQDEWCGQRSFVRGEEGALIGVYVTNLIFAWS